MLLLSASVHVPGADEVADQPDRGRRGEGSFQWFRGQTLRMEGTVPKILLSKHFEAESNQSGCSECVHCNDRRGMNRAARAPRVSSGEIDTTKWTRRLCHRVKIFSTTHGWT